MQQAIATASIKIRLLGGFEVRTTGGELVQISSKKAQALVAYLALVPTMTASRDKIAGLLWSESDNEHARNSLRQTLATLRRDFADKDLEVLASLGDTVSLVTALSTSDVSRLQHVVATKANSDTVDFDTLYPGSFLDGFHSGDPAFEDWAAFERQRLHDLAILVLESLSRQLRNEARISCTRRLLAIDPTREASHQLMIECLLEAGNHDQALKQYEICKARLQDEFSVRPGPRTEQLRQSVLASLTAVTPPRPRVADVRRPVIGVRGFTDLSEQEETSFFVDGLTQDIVTALCRFKELLVIGLSPASRRKIDLSELNEVVKQRGVEYILEGTVRKLDQRFRITAHLVSTATGSPVWAERYDRQIGDIFAVQDDVVKSIVTTTVGRIVSVIGGNVDSAPRMDVAAYELVLRARKALESGNMPAAEPLLKRALEIEPDLAQAYANLSHVSWVRFNDTLLDVHIKESVSLAKRAVTLDDSDALCHAHLGFTYLFDRQYDLAAIHNTRAIELNSGDFTALHFYAHMLGRTGRADEALKVLDDVIRRDPFSSPCYWENRSIILYVLGRYDESIDATMRLREFQWWNHYQLAASHAQANRIEEAKSAAAEVLRLKPDATIELIMKAEPYKYPENAQLLIEGLRKAGLPVS